ncbi:minor capsid protein [Dorea longicatena]|uniref:minor capsid protein n=1 Tax=Dorea longicatena TaxID=88431 RepID=UPI00210E0B9D|nr:minor capsid protein [Dorea longicatena]MCQ4891664.1 minor capsid protein [Dorea longicatena]
MASQEYWKNRETEAKKHNIQEEAEYNRKIKEIYANMMDEINKEINGFYTKYAAKEGITMAEAKKRVSKLDIAAYERKAKKYVETKDLSDRANEEMRIYNLTMKVNRLELLKANIGLEMVSGFDEMQKYFDKKLTDRTLKEFQRQAGILGKSVLKNEKYAHAIVNASFKNATYSDRIWMYQGMLKAELEGLLASGLIRGQNPKKLAKHLEKRFGVSAYNAQRLMTTELARVQTEAQKQSFIRNGFDEYVYVACTKGDVCPICKGLDDKHFKVDDMMPGENAPPMHPNYHCSTAAYMDNEAYEEWINSYQEHGLNFEDWKASRESEESKKKYKYADTVVKKSLLTSSEYRKKFNQVSGNSKVNRRAWNISKDMLSHRSGTKFEDLAFINVVNGKYAVNKDYDVESKANMNKQMKQLLEESEPETIIAIHNHPGSSVPSIPDIRVCIQRGYKKGIIACHDGKVYIYSVDSKKYNEPIAMSALDRLEKKGYTEEVVKRLKDAGISLEVL